MRKKFRPVQLIHSHMKEWIQKLLNGNANINVNRLHCLLFGRYYSDNYGAYRIYKLTRSKLFIDRSESWHKDRHTAGGYIFSGELMSSTAFELVKHTFDEVPSTIVNSDLRSFYATGNKNEDALIIDVNDGRSSMQVTLDYCEYGTKYFPAELGDLKRQMYNSIKQLRELENYT